MMRAGKQDRIAEVLLAIPRLSRQALLEQWKKARGNPAPKGISRRLLEYSAAYQIQVKAFGGLKPATRRKLRAVSKTTGKSSVATTPPRKSDGLGAGARLLREWHGRTHTVEVTDGASDIRRRRTSPSRRLPGSSQEPGGRDRGSSGYEQSGQVCRLHTQVHRRRIGPGVQQPGCAT